MKKNSKCDIISVLWRKDRDNQQQQKNSHPLEGCPPRGGVVTSKASNICNSNVMRNTKQYMSLPYNPALKQRAKALRRAGNLSEVLLWKELKNKQFSGIDFDRQKIIGNFIVDFYCAEKQIVIEIDGSSHNSNVAYDKERDALLERVDLVVIHLLDSDIAGTATTPPLGGHPSKGWE